MYTDNDFEAELADLIGATTKDLDPPVGIVEQGARRGRRMQRYARLRTAAAAAGVAAVTVGVLGAVAVSGPNAGGRAPADAAAQGGATASATATPTAKPIPATIPAPKGHVRLTDAQGERVLAELLPPGHISWDPASAVRGLATMFGNYHPAGTTHGFQVSFLVTPGSGEHATSNACPVGLSDEGPRPHGAPPAACEVRPMPGGGFAVVLVTVDDEQGFYDYQVNLFRADGVEVCLTIANGTSPSRSNPVVTVSAPTPPIRMQQLITIAKSPLWK